MATKHFMTDRDLTSQRHKVKVIVFFMDPALSSVHAIETYHSPCM